MIQEFLFCNFLNFWPKQNSDTATLHLGHFWHHHIYNHHNFSIHSVSSRVDCLLSDPSPLISVLSQMLLMYPCQHLYSLHSEMNTCLAYAAGSSVSSNLLCMLIFRNLSYVLFPSLVSFKCSRVTSFSCLVIGFSN
jgi:hypothetical protein